MCPWAGGRMWRLCAPMGRRKVRAACRERTHAGRCSFSATPAAACNASCSVHDDRVLGRRTCCACRVWRRGARPLWVLPRLAPLAIMRQVLPNSAHFSVGKDPTQLGLRAIVAQLRVYDYPLHAAAVQQDWLDSRAGMAAPQASTRIQAPAPAHPVRQWVERADEEAHDGATALTRHAGDAFPPAAGSVDWAAQAGDAASEAYDRGAC